MKVRHQYSARVVGLGGIALLAGIPPRRWKKSPPFQKNSSRYARFVAESTTIGSPFVHVSVVGARRAP